MIEFKITCSKCGRSETLTGPFEPLWASELVFIVPEFGWKGAINWNSSNPHLWCSEKCQNG